MAKFIGCLLVSVSSLNAQNITFKLVEIPNAIHPNQVYLAGDLNGWNPRNPQYQFNSSGVLRVKGSKPGLFSYKFTLGNWDQVETQLDGNDVENRVLMLQQDTLVEISILAFKKAGANKNLSTASVQVKTQSFFFPRLGYSKNVRIYFPPNYHQTQIRYPVIYMHDGQNLYDVSTSAFGEWKVDETLDSIYRITGKSCIVVGIDHGDSLRISEYLPYTTTQFKKARGREYIQDLVYSLKPFVDGHLRTLTTPVHTWIAGSSMGALISTFAAQEYPKVFGGVGIFSPAFWLNPMVGKNGLRRCMQVYLYAGEQESNSLVQEVNQFYDQLRKCSRKAQLKIIDPNGKHSENAWARHFPAFAAMVIGK